MALKIPPDAKVYKPAMFPIFLLIFFGGIALGTIGFIILIMATEENVDLWALVFALAFAYVIGFFYSAFCSFLLSFFFPIALSAGEIYAHSFWGLRRYIPWTEIASVKPFRLINLVWLKLYSNQNNRVVYMWLFVKKGEEFRAEIKRLAPADSPVLTCLKIES
jgi:hypothetical protein